MVAGSLKYDTKLDSKGFEKGLDGLSSKAVAIGNIMAQAFTKIASAMADGVKQGVTYNAQSEQYQTALTTLTGSATEADRIMKQIKEDASKTPFDVQGLTQANQLLISAGINGDRAREDVLALGNAISATGGGNEELSRMAVNLQQIKNVGKASALDIKQFAYAGIDVYGLLADSMGITREDATKMDVTYEDLTKALKDASQEGGKYYGAMENQSKTLNGQISTLKDNFLSFAGEASEPLFNFLKNEALPVLNQLLDGTLSFDEAIPQLTQKLLDFAMNVITKLIEMLPQIIEIGIQVIVSLIQGIAQQLPTLIPQIIKCVVLIVETLIDNIDLIIEAGIDLIVGLALGLVEAIPRLLEKIPEIITKLSIALTKPEVMVKLINAGIQLIVGLAKGLIQAIPQLILMIPKIIYEVNKEFIKTIKNTDWKKLGIDILKGILNGLINFGSFVTNTINKLKDKIVGKIKSVFGIHSPSALMRDVIGKNLILGVGVSFDKDADLINKQIDNFGDDVVNKIQRAVNVETGRMSMAGINGNVSQILSANSVIEVNNNNVLELDGEQIYTNQNKIQQRKNLQYGFGGATIR